MIRTLKRNDCFHIDCQIGETRLRGALGTKDKQVASRLRSRIEMAIAEGSRSKNWTDLRLNLPASTYQRFAKATGLKIEEVPTWKALQSIFWTDCQGKIKLGKMSQNTYTRYDYALEAFDRYLVSKGMGKETLLTDIKPAVIEAYKVTRYDQILARCNSKDGNGLAVEVSVLYSVFQTAVDRGMLESNPVRKGHTKTQTEVNPFTGEELQRLRDACQNDNEWLIYLVFRYTGLRVSDVADLRWEHVQNGEIVKRTIKRGKIVHIPMHLNLLTALETIRGEDSQPVLITKNKSKTTAQLRRLVRQIGCRAGVENIHPHRFRHTFATEMLFKGATVWEVGQLLGDTAAAIEKSYAKFTTQFRDRLKELVERDCGFDEGLLEVQGNYVFRGIP